MSSENSSNTTKFDPGRKENEKRITGDRTLNLR
jgi:hypothetical protein